MLADSHKDLWATMENAKRDTDKDVTDLERTLDYMQLRVMQMQREDLESLKQTARSLLVNARNSVYTIADTLKSVVKSNIL